MLKTPAYAAASAQSTLAPFSIERREPGPRDVLINILYCGVCHSDIHQVRDEWGGSIYPMVPGHEIVGTVVQVGSEVTKWRLGDIVGVGCFVDSCRECAACKEGKEQFCERGASFTYNCRDKTATTHLRRLLDPHHSGRGLRFRIPPGIPLERAAPLLCAGITTYSPLRHFA